VLDDGSETDLDVISEEIGAERDPRTGDERGAAKITPSSHEWKHEVIDVWATRALVRDETRPPADPEIESTIREIAADGQHRWTGVELGSRPHRRTAARHARACGEQTRLSVGHRRGKQTGEREPAQVGSKARHGWARWGVLRAQKMNGPVSPQDGCGPNGFKPSWSQHMGRTPPSIASQVSFSM